MKLIAGQMMVVAFLSGWFGGSPHDRQALFDGRSLRGWRGDAAWWSVQEGAITGEIPAGQQLGRNQFLFYEKSDLRDFVLDFDFRITGGPSANSGVQLRSAERAHGEAAGYQADLDDGATWLGRIYDEGGRGLLVERGTTVSIGPGGGKFAQTWAAPASFRGTAVASNWNHYTIAAIGPRIELRVNGRLHAILEDHEKGQADAAGRLALQLHSGPGPAKVQFKNILLRTVDHASAARAGSKEDAATAEAPDAGRTPPGLNLDFEKGTLEGWTATGVAMKNQPVEGDTVGARRGDMRSNHEGRFWIGTYERAQDGGTGTLVSAPFPVTQPWASFLVGGGRQEATRVEILEMPSSNVIFTARGRDRENMERVAVDLGGQTGKHIAIRLVDDGRGGWGHINFDDFRFHARRPAPGTEPDGGDGGSPIMRHLVPNPVAAGTTNVTASMRVPPGFRVDLIAAEPDVTQPVAFAIDERGRLWVLEAHSYPQKRDKGLDRIVIFADEDGDGSFETRKVFMEGLNLASGIEIGFGGVFVGAAPELLFIPDRNRDDVPDGPPEVLLDGWGHQDTHETLNSFLWGPDGWLYGNHGVFTHSRVGRPGTPDPDRREIKAGVWRYHPVTKQFEVFAHGGSNQWGLDYDEHGALFMTHCRSAWGRGPVTYVIRGGHYWNQANGGHAPFISGGPAGFTPDKPEAFRNFLLASARYGHGTGGAGKPGSDAIYGGHSHVGTMIYLGNNWPLSYRGQLFTHNLFGRQLNREVNLPEGSGYNTISASADAFHCEDPTYMGIDLQYGPDGSVFMIDWTDKQQCHHNDVNKWDRSNGRLYRMAWTETWKPARLDLGRKSDKELVALLTHENAWYGRTARRLLQERVAANTVTSKSVRRELPKRAVQDAAAPDMLSHVWTAYVTGVLGESEWTKLLAATNAQVRAWAVTLLTDTPATNAAAALRARLPELAANDPSPVVRLALASALQRVDQAEAWPIAEKLAMRREDADDRYIPAMIWYGIARRAAADAERTMALAERTPLPVLADSISWFLALEPETRAHLVARLPDLPPTRRGRVMELLAFALDGRGLVAPPGSWNEVKAKLSADAAPEQAEALERLRVIFGDREAIARLRAVLADRKAGAKKRHDALAFLDKANDIESLPIFIELLAEAGFRKESIPLVGRMGGPAAAPRLIAALAQADAEERVLIANTLSGRPQLARALLEEIRAGRADRSIITALQARQISNLGDAELTKLLGEAWGKVNVTTEAGRQAAEKYKKLYHEAPKWAHEMKDGELAFTKVCAACHAINGKGGNLGPDLGGAWRSGAAYFIENIVEPNAVVGEAYQLNILTLNDGAVVSGMVHESGDTLTVTAAAGVSQTVKKADVKTRQVLEQSVMPMGLLDVLPQKEVIDLIKYLTTEKK